MEINWITDVIMPLLSAFIGGILALLGVIVSLKHENNKNKEERLDKAKPIVINYMSMAVDRSIPTPRYILASDEQLTNIEITGVFKNTDNGILFIDYIKTERKKYYPCHSSTVDKNTVFYIKLNVNEGENMKDCALYCHDIFGTRYYYEITFCFEPGRQSEMLIGNIQSYKVNKHKTQ